MASSSGGCARRRAERDRWRGRGRTRAAGAPRAAAAAPNPLPWRAIPGGSCRRRSPRCWASAHSPPHPGERAHRDVGAARGQRARHDHPHARIGPQQQRQRRHPIHDRHLDVEHDRRRCVRARCDAAAHPAPADRSPRARPRAPADRSPACGRRAADDRGIVADHDPRDVGCGRRIGGTRGVGARVTTGRPAQTCRGECPRRTAS